MKKLLWLLGFLAVLWGLVFITSKVKPDIFRGPKTTVKVHEGLVSVYLRGKAGEKEEYLGTLQKGETVEVYQKKMDFFNTINVARLLIPKAVGLFKTVIGGFSAGKPIGRYERFFTDEDFERYITSKLKRRWWPDLKVAMHPEGYEATGTLTVGNLSISGYSTGLIGVDQTKSGKMYAAIYDVKVGNFRFPGFMRALLEKSVNAVINRGSYIIEIRDMKYREGGIDITYYKVDAPGEKIAGKVGPAPSEPEAENDQKTEEMLRALAVAGGAT